MDPDILYTREYIDLLEDQRFISSVLHGGRDIYCENENGYIALIVAAKYGWTEIIELLLDMDETQLDYQCHSQDFQEVDTFKIVYTAALMATINDKYSTLEYLVSRGACLNASAPPVAFIAYFCSASNKYLELVVNSGVDFNHIRNGIDGVSDGLTFLTSIPKYSLNNLGLPEHFLVDRLRYLLDNGADMKVRDLTGHTLLHRAIFFRQVHMIKLLLGRMDKIDFQDINMLDYSKIFMDVPDDVEAVEPKLIRNIFTYTCRYGSLDDLKMMSPYMNSQEYFRDCDESLCLLHAASLYRMRGDWFKPEDLFEMVKYLLDNGANVNKCRIWSNKHNTNIEFPLIGEYPSIEPYFKKKYSLLGMAILNRQIYLLPLLLEHGAEVEPSCDFIVDPLAVTVLVGNVESCKILLTHGANPNRLVKRGFWIGCNSVRHHNNLRPITMMTACVYVHILFELLKAGGDLNLIPEHLWTELQVRCPFHYKCLQQLKQIFSGQTLNINKSSSIKNHREASMTIDNHQFCFVNVNNKRPLCALGKGFTSLQHLCRAAIVQRILIVNGHVPYKSFIDNLEVNHYMIPYLKYETNY